MKPKLQTLHSLIAACLFIVLFSAQPVHAADLVDNSGDALQILIPAAAYGATFYLDDSSGRTQFYKSFFTSLGITYGLKYSIDKKRPNGKDHSFPSGHTSAAFQGAAFIHKRYGLEYGIPAYIGASFVGYSRIETKNHDIVDVLAGAAIGAGSSFFFTEPFLGFTVIPVSDHRLGITLSKSW